MKRVSYLLLRNVTTNEPKIVQNQRRYVRTRLTSSATSTEDIINLHSTRYSRLISGEDNSLARMESACWKDKLEYAAACHRAGTEEALNALILLAKNNFETRTNAANRLLYLAMDMALNQNRLDIAGELCKLLPCRVHVIATSLKIRLFVRQECFWDALTEIEKVLNEDTACLDVSTKISQSVLDEFYSAISSRQDKVDEAKRFFTLQRLISKYNKRTKKTLTELLFSDMVVTRRGSLLESLKIDDHLLDKIVKHVPEVLTDDKL